MLCGEEMLRDKKGVHNSFESPDSINHLDWNNLEKYPQVFNYYKNLIAMRKHHPAFRLGKAELVREHLEFMPVQDCLVAFRLKDHAGGDEWKDIIVILNSSREPRIVDVPEDQYTIVACDGVINEQGLGTIAGCHVTVDPQSALIIHN
jgi:pullulanase